VQWLLETAGTMGAALYPYFIADPTFFDPVRHEGHVSGKIILALPHT